jgi:hypothetical protein
MSKVPYSSANGSLMYEMACTRTDIAHVVGVVRRYMNNLGKKDWEEVNWILGYLRGTATHALSFGGSDIALKGYVDSYMAGDKDSRRITIGYDFIVGGTTVRRSTIGYETIKRFLHFQQQKQSMLFLQRLVKKSFGYICLWWKWERRRRITGCIVIVRVSFFLQRTPLSIQRLRMYISSTI